MYLLIISFLVHGYFIAASILLYTYTYPHACRCVLSICLIAIGKKQNRNLNNSHKLIVESSSSSYGTIKSLPGSNNQWQFKHYNSFMWYTLLHVQYYTYETDQPFPILINMGHILC